MTEEQIHLVKKTWKVFRGIDPHVIGDTFYSKLFTDQPGLRKLFPKNMDDQYRKLIDMLSTVVGRLEKMDELSDDIAAMAHRHVQYGVRPAHYKLVGNALLWTLKQGLGKDWTPEVHTAWTTCYTAIADTMINASSGTSVR